MDAGAGRPPAATSEAFSLARGGPFERFLERGRLVDDGSIRPMRAVALLVLLTWMPLLLLSIASGTAWGTSVRIPFLEDFVSQARWLVALPLLVYAESVVDPRLATIVSFFRRGELVPAEAAAQFEEALASLSRSRAGRASEVGVLLVVIVGTIFLVLGVSGGHLEQGVTTWWLAGSSADGHLTVGGWWYALVSIPVFQFVFVLWLWRMVLWGRFLWSLSRLDLALVPAHPDRVGGLGFLSGGQSSFAIIFVALGAVVSGAIANQIVHDGRTLAEFQTEIAVYVACSAALVLLPLVFFARRLAEVKRRARLEYGALGNRLARKFHAVFVEAPHDDNLFETPLVSALADFGPSFSTVSEMHALPVDLRGSVQLLAKLAAPFIPLLLSEMSAREIAQHLLKVLM